MGEERTNSQKKQVKPHGEELSVILKTIITIEAILIGYLSLVFSGAMNAHHVLKVVILVIVVSVGFVLLANLLIDRYVGRIMAEYRQREEERIAELALENKTFFLNNVSHEIRTPVNAVLGMNEMILRESKEDNIRRYAREIRTSGRTLLALIDDILDSSKLETGELQLEPVEYDLNSLISDAVNSYGFRAKEKKLEFWTE